MHGKLAAIMLAMLALTSVAMADDANSFAQAKAIIEQRIPCSQLSANQIEMIGNYYMEQIHPGAAHEAMDQMMGGEGSPALEQMHYNMGYANYCDTFNAGTADYNSTYEGYGMIGYGAGYGGYGMMGPGYGSTYNGYGMMNGYAGGYGPQMMYGYGSYENNSWLGGLGGLNTVLLTIALLLVIGFFGMKMVKDMKEHKRHR